MAASVASLLLAIIGCITVFIFIGFLIFPLAILVGIAGLLYHILGAVRASEKKVYEYPWTTRFTK